MYYSSSKKVNGWFCLYIRILDFRFFCICVMVLIFFYVRVVMKFLVRICNIYKCFFDLGLRYCEKCRCIKFDRCYYCLVCG